MARIKYYYDTETCKYERVKVTTWDVSLNLMGFLAVAMILAIGIVMISSAYFEPPKEALLRKDNEELLFHNSLQQHCKFEMMMFIASSLKLSQYLLRLDMLVSEELKGIRNLWKAILKEKN